MVTWIRYLHCCVLLSYLYKVVAQCGGTAQTVNIAETYNIQTLQYPASGSYGEDLDCSWILESGTNKLLMYLTVSQLANGDLLFFFDGTSTAGSSLFSTSPSGETGLSVSVMAPSGASFIRFTSNSIAEPNQLGFTVQYMSAVTDDKGGCVSAVNLEATDTKQYLTSPNFPQEYPASISCSWTINSKDSCGSLVLDFVLLDIETECSADSVSITYDGNAPIQLCPSDDWDSASDFTTTGTVTDITLTTDSSEQKRGFVMSYRRTGCLITTTATTGTTTDVTTVATMTVTSTDTTTTDVTTVGTMMVTSTTTTSGITTETQPSTTAAQTTSDASNITSSVPGQGDADYLLILVILVVPVVGVIIVVVVIIHKNKQKPSLNYASKNRISPTFGQPARTTPPKLFSGENSKV